MTTFTHAGREWVVDRCLTERETREFVRIRPAKPRPRPTREEYRAAREAYFGATNEPRRGHRDARSGTSRYIGSGDAFPASERPRT